MSVSVTAEKFAVTLPGMWRFFPQMRVIVSRARRIAREQGSAVVTEAHLFIAILDLTNDPESTVSALLGASSVSREEARIYAKNALEHRPAKRSNQPRLTRGARLALDSAFQEAERDCNLSVEARHLFIACARPRQTNVLLAPVGRSHALHLGDVLLSLGLDVTRLREHLRGLKRIRKPYPNGNPLNDLSPNAREAVEVAHRAARASFCGKIAPAHLLLGLLNDPKSAEVFQSAGCDLEDLRLRARQFITTDSETATPQKRFSAATRQVLEHAAREAKRRKRNFIDCEALRRALIPPASNGDQRYETRRPAQDVGMLGGLWTPAQIQLLQESRAEAEEVELHPTEEFSDEKAVRFRLFLSVAFTTIVGFNTYLVVSSLIGGGLVSNQQAAMDFARLAIPPLTAIAVTVALEGPLSYGQGYALRFLGGMALGAGVGWLWWHFF